jgi:uncharacterized SAM-dependent methyltransferase
LSKGSTVFVVYGRNKAARNAVFNFLRALKLHPLQWSQAAALTEKASPTTLEVVAAGLAASQCAVLLFTADDSVQLRPSLGHEPPSFQPRPNVLLEAGYALAMVGVERTILVRAGALREVSDLAGLDYVHLRDEPHVRNAFVERLRAAGCSVDTSGGDYLRAELTGSFEGSFDEDDQPNVLVRGGFTDFIVDSAISHTMNSLELFAQAESYLRNRATVDIRYNYLGVLGARNWLAISQDPDYPHSELMTLYRRSIPEIITAAGLEGTDVDYISLGPGDGEIDVYMLRELVGRANLLNYYPIDISLELLQKAVEEVIECPFLERSFQMKAIHGDFTQLARYRPIFAFDSSVNLFCLAGFSLGNYREAELIGKVLEGMNEGDYLLLDARLHDFGSTTENLTQKQRDEIVRNYSHRVHNRFAFGPIEMLTDAQYDKEKFVHEVTTRLTQVPNALSVLIAVKDVNARFRFKGEYEKKTALKEKRINLGFTTVYDESSLEQWLQGRGFAIKWKKKEKGTLVLLLHRL